MIESYLEAWQRFIEFHGRTTRQSYWLFMLCHLTISLLLVFLDLLTRLEMVIVVDLLYGLASFLPLFAASVRRLHDSNHSGWWLCCIGIPAIGWLLVFYLLVLSSNEEGSRFDMQGISQH